MLLKLYFLRYSYCQDPWNYLERWLHLRRDFQDFPAEMPSVEAPAWPIRRRRVMFGSVLLQKLSHTCISCISI